MSEGEGPLGHACVSDGFMYRILQLLTVHCLAAVFTSEFKG